jgi:hypothetical protein
VITLIVLFGYLSILYSVMLVKLVWKNDISKFSRNRASWKPLTALLDIDDSLLLSGELPLAVAVVMLSLVAAVVSLPPAATVVLWQSGAAAIKLPATIVNA